MKRIQKNTLAAILLFVLYSCKTQSVYTDKPAKGLVNTENDLLEINALLFHANDSLTNLFLAINNENLLYKYTDTSLFPYARLRLHYKLSTMEKSPKLVDSASFEVFDRAEADVLTSRSIFTNARLKAKYAQDYALELFVIDLNKHIQYNKEVYLNKKDRVNRQNFLVSQKGNLIYGQAVKPGDTLQIKVNQTLEESLLCEEFRNDLPIAAPPFSTKAPGIKIPEPDSSTLVFLQDGGLNLVMPQKGFLHLKFKQSDSKGLSLFSFPSSFPGIASADEMINCTRYIMTKEEFENCKGAQNKKQAIDKFWLELGGSNERAKELLKRYYARVREANKMFSGFSEGWKSDRGMIFIVFGQPNSVVLRDDQEQWVYGNAANQNTSTFIFNRIPNPYSDNVYELDRSQLYKGLWSNAVDMWRQGLYYEGRK